MSQLAASEGQPGNWEEPGSFCVGLKLRGLKRKAGRSRVNREVHARICGSVGVRFPCATRLTGSQYQVFCADPPILHTSPIVIVFLLIAPSLVHIDLINNYAYVY